jgi:hypothetical protein
MPRNWKSEKSIGKRTRCTNCAGTGMTAVLKS